MDECISRHDTAVPAARMKSEPKSTKGRSSGARVRSPAGHHPREAHRGAGEGDTHPEHRSSGDRGPADASGGCGACWPLSVATSSGACNPLRRLILSSGHSARRPPHPSLRRRRRNASVHRSLAAVAARCRRRRALSAFSGRARACLALSSVIQQRRQRARPIWSSSSWRAAAAASRASGSSLTSLTQFGALADGGTFTGAAFPPFPPPPLRATRPLLPPPPKKVRPPRRADAATHDAPRGLSLAAQRARTFRLGPPLDFSARWGQRRTYGWVSPRSVGPRFRCRGGGLRSALGQLTCVWGSMN